MDEKKDPEVTVIRGPLSKVLPMLKDDEQEMLLKTISKSKGIVLTPPYLNKLISEFVKSVPKHAVSMFKDDVSELDSQASLYSYSIMFLTYLEKIGEVTLKCRKES